MNKYLNSLFASLVIAGIILLATLGSSCGVYRFSDASIPDSIKTVKINFFENKAPYINPQLSPKLTDKFRQKVLAQTRLTQTNNDNADWEISATITQYSFITSAIAGRQTATNRLSVGVQVTLYDRKTEETRKVDVTRSWEFQGTQTIQEAESNLGDELVRTLSDEIFNKVFSNW
jgi:hypothetical protein